MICSFCVVFDSWLVSRICPTYVLEVLQSVPHRLAPYLLGWCFWDSELSWYNESKLEVIILGWVLLFVVLPEGCRYIRDGILDCSQSQDVISCCWKVYLSDSHGRGVNDLIAVGSCEGVEEDVVAETNGCEVLSKSIPTCSFTGIFSSNEVSHELILFGSVTIWKCCGRWEGHFVNFFCQFDRNCVKGHWWHCSHIQGTTGSFPFDAFLEEEGGVMSYGLDTDFYLNWGWHCLQVFLGSGSCGANPQMLSCPSSRGHSCLVLNGLPACWSMERWWMPHVWGGCWSPRNAIHLGFQRAIKPFVWVTTKAEWARIHLIDVSRTAEWNEVNVDTLFCNVKETKHEEEVLQTCLVDVNRAAVCG